MKKGKCWVIWRFAAAAYGLPTKDRKGEEFESECKNLRNWREGRFHPKDELKHGNVREKILDALFGGEDKLLDWRQDLEEALDRPLELSPLVKSTIRTYNDDNNRKETSGLLRNSITLETKKLPLSYILSTASNVLHQVIAKAREWEQLQEQALVFGKEGEIDKGREAFLASARCLGSIIDLYNTHPYVFGPDAQGEISDLLNLIENGDENANYF